MTEKDSKDSTQLRRAGCAFNLSGRLGQYLSLMYGFFAVNQNDVDIKKVVLGGLAYGTFSFIEYVSSLIAYRAEGEVLKETTNELKDKISHLERKISGKSVSAKILDPNKPFNERSKLDEMVERDLREAEKKDNKPKPYGFNK
jgi:hypothetical protein